MLLLAVLRSRTIHHTVLKVSSCSPSYRCITNLVRKLIGQIGNISHCLGKEELVRWCEVQPWDTCLAGCATFKRSICANSYPLFYLSSQNFAV